MDFTLEQGACIQQIVQLFIYVSLTRTALYIIHLESYPQKKNKKKNKKIIINMNTNMLFCSLYVRFVPTGAR